MRVLRDSRGISQTELVLVVAVATLLIIAMLATVLSTVTQAREDALTARARTVYITAQLVIEQIPATDEEYMLGLGGLSDDSPSPAVANISRRMNALLATGDEADITLSGSAPMPRYSSGPISGTAEFTVADGKITKLVYTDVSGNSKYAVTIIPGEETVSVRVN